MPHFAEASAAGYDFLDCSPSRNDDSFTRRTSLLRERLMPAPLPCPGPRISRRQMIQAGAASYLGLSLPQLLLRRRGAPQDHRRSADACIVIFLNGGPSHLDMWDMKPDAPAEIRGEFKPIATSVPGVQLRRAPAAVRPADAPLHRRSARCTTASTTPTRRRSTARLTGHDRGEIGGGARPDDYPAIGSVVGMQRPPATAGRAATCRCRTSRKEGAGGPPQPGFFGGWLGRTHDPLFVLRDPNAADFAHAGTDARPGHRPRPLRRAARSSTASSPPRAGEPRDDDMDGFQARRRSTC